MKTLEQTHTEILLIGGSAGSLKVLFEVLPKVNTPLRFPLVLVVHRRADPNSYLEDLLRKYTDMAVAEVEDKMNLMANTLYLAPADYHVLVESKSELSLDDSEKLHFSRPAIDATLQSAAEIFGENTSAIVLSGANADGSRGMKRIHECGGLTVVQDPETAEIAYMPREIMHQVEVDYVLRPEQMADFINTLNKNANTR